MSDRKWPILEFVTEEMSLENIFLRLTDSKFTTSTKKTAKKDENETEEEYTSILDDSNKEGDK